LRAALGGYVDHVLNRGNSRATVFHKNGDYEAFERVMVKALEHTPGMRLICYTLITT
jgi:putative transposase